MQRYKSIFKETLIGDKFSKQEAMTTVNISGLVWSKTFTGEAWSSYKGSLKPNGYRLPTIQELYTACVQNKSGFTKKDMFNYLSNDLTEDGNYVWAVNFLEKKTNTKKSCDDAWRLR